MTGKNSFPVAAFQYRSESRTSKRLARGKSSLAVFLCPVVLPDKVPEPAGPDASQANDVVLALDEPAAWFGNMAHVLLAGRNNTPSSVIAVVALIPVRPTDRRLDDRVSGVSPDDIVRLMNPDSSDGLTDAFPWTGDRYEAKALGSAAMMSS